MFCLFFLTHRTNTVKILQVRMQKETCVHKTGQVIGVILGRTELLAFEMEENFEHNEKKTCF